MELTGFGAKRYKSGLDLSHPGGEWCIVIGEERASVLAAQMSASSSCRWYSLFITRRTLT